MQTQFYSLLYKGPKQEKRLLKSLYTTYLHYIQASLRRTSSKKYYQTFKNNFLALIHQGEPSR